MPEAETNLADKAALDAELIAKARSFAPGLQTGFTATCYFGRQPRAKL